jgi:hypothetical protein
MRRADHSSRGGLPSAVCLISVIANPLRRDYDPESGRNATVKKLMLQPMSNAVEHLYASFFSHTGGHKFQTQPQALLYKQSPCE